jgi:hypothetical protein
MNKNKPTINCSFPAKILSFETIRKNENEMFSRGKLAVFYKGETADHRYFSDNFSKELIASLPYTPIVSYYNKDKKDFEGHAENQAVYGIVCPDGIEFQTLEDGHEWAVCNTIYYTERPGEVGEIAKQIEGHSQSLELTDAKYVVNYDEKRHFKNVEFTAGKFIGVSVLGDDQTPAFTGSAFFSEDKFSEKFAKLREFYKSEASLGQKDENVSNGGQMKISSYLDFMNLTWGEISSKVEQAMEKAYGDEAYTVVLDFEGDSKTGFVYAGFYSYIDGSYSTYKVEWSIGENGEVSLGKATKVRRTWEEIPDTSAQSKEEINAEKMEKAEKDEEVVEDNTPTSASDMSTDNDAAKSESPVSNTNAQESASKDTDIPLGNVDQLSSSEGDGCNDTEESSSANMSADEGMPSDASDSGDALNVNESPLQEDSSVTTPTMGQGGGHETDSFEEKLVVLNKYQDTLNEENFKKFSSSLSSYGRKEDLEIAILQAIVKQEQEAVESRQPAVLAYAVKENAETADNASDDWVAKYLSR